MPNRPSLHAVETGVCFVDVVHKLNDSFDTGKTQSLEWRKSQLKALETLLKDNQHDILQALKNDLGKCKTEAMAAEQGFLLSDIKHTLTSKHSTMLCSACIELIYGKHIKYC